MKIKYTEARFEATFNKGNYESEKFGLAGVIEEGGPVEALIHLKELVQEAYTGVPAPVKEQMELVPLSKEEEAPPPVVEEKKEPAKKRGPKAKTEKKAEGTVYDRENPVHKNMFGKLLSEIDPHWRNAPEVGKETSIAMAGRLFLDEEGLVIPEFKEKTMEEYKLCKMG